MNKNIKSGFLFFLILTTLLSCHPNDNTKNYQPPAPLQDEPAIKAAEKNCPDFISVIDQNLYDYGWVKSLENPNDPNSPLLNIFYIKPKKLSDNVVAFYNGGPGSSVHGSFGFLEALVKFKNLTDKISFVYIDQRGNGCSSPYPKGEDEKLIQRQIWYGSRGIVYDSEVIRKTLLGEKKWKIFGQSYGAYIVHRYAMLFPHSIEKAYAHANAISDDPIERLTYRIESQVLMSKEYFKQNPEDIVPFKILKNYLTTNKDFCITTPKYLMTYCGLDIVEYLNSSLGFKDGWSYLHFLINQWVQDGQISKDEIQAELNIGGDDPYSENSQTFAVIAYFDRNIAVNDKTTCNQVFNILKLRKVESEDLSLHECLSSIQFGSENTSREKIKSELSEQQDIMTYDNFRKSLLQMPSKSFYLYSGELDTFVPYTTFKKEVDIVGDLLNYTQFKNSGHDGFYSEDQIWEDLQK